MPHVLPFIPRTALSGRCCVHRQCVEGGMGPASWSGGEMLSCHSSLKLALGFFLTSCLPVNRDCCCVMLIWNYFLSRKMSRSKRKIRFNMKFCIRRKLILTRLLTETRDNWSDVQLPWSPCPTYPDRGCFKETSQNERWANHISLLVSRTIYKMMMWHAVAINFGRCLCNSCSIFYFEYFVREPTNYHLFFFKSNTVSVKQNLFLKN